MTRLRRDIYRRKLNELLTKAPDEPFLRMCWAGHAIQNGRAEYASSFFLYPREAGTTDISSPYALHLWSIETLINERLALPPIDPDGRRLLDCGRFEAIRQLLNILRKLENAEDRLMLDRLPILETLHLLGQRQFEWQKGSFSYAQLYRSGRIYGGTTSAAYYTAQRGFSLHQLTLAAYLLRSLFMTSPAIDIRQGFPDFGVTEPVLRLIMSSISMPIEHAKRVAREIRRAQGHTGYKRSLLRTHPVIEFNGRYYSPLIDLLTKRATDGLFYDFASADSNIKNEISRRFHCYSMDLISSMYPALIVLDEYRYAAKKGENYDAPDIRLADAQGLRAIVECKATRMSYEARFAERPMTADPRGYGEIVKAVIQIWRYVSHHRRGFFDEDWSPHVTGLVLTMDNWLTAAHSMIDKVLDDARRQTAGVFEDADRIPIAFCSIDDLESTIHIASDAAFLSTIAAAGTEKFKGYQLWTVLRDGVKHAPCDNDYPFRGRMKEAYPWWEMLEAALENERGT